MALFGKFLGAYSLKYGLILPKFSPEVVLYQEKAFKDFFLEKEWTQNLGFCNFDHPFSPDNGLNRKKYIFTDQGSISRPVSVKNMITFCTLWAILGRKQGVVTRQRVRIKIGHILFHPHGSWLNSSKTLRV